MQKLYDQCLKIINNQLDEYDEQMQREVPEGEHAEEHLPHYTVCNLLFLFELIMSQIRESIEGNVVALMDESAEICKTLKSLKSAVRQHADILELKKLKHLTTDDDFETEDAKETVWYRHQLYILNFQDHKHHG